MWDLIPWPAIESRLLALGVGSLSYWTMGKCLVFLLFNFSLFPPLLSSSIHMASFLYADSPQIYTSSPFEPQALDSASYRASPLGWEAAGLLYTHPPEKPVDALRLYTHSHAAAIHHHVLHALPFNFFQICLCLSPLFPLHCPHFHSISPKSLWQLPFRLPASPPDEWSYRDINM